MWPFNSNKYTLADLQKINLNASVSRTNIRIAIIEDIDFPLMDLLRNHNFNITLFRDIQTLDVVSEFDIIVTDIHGVGMNLDPILQGAHLIEEIVKKYPNKILICYSASNWNPSMSKYFGLCDFKMRKDEMSAEWVTVFDESINKLKNPIFQWEKTRKILMENGVPMRDIHKLELQYAKSIIKGNKSYFNGIVENKRNQLENPVVKFALDSILRITTQILIN